MSHMGYFFEFDAVNNVLRCSWTGQITDDILWEGYSATGKVITTQPTCRCINDFSGVTEFDVSNETIRRLSDTPAVLRPESVHVVVAPQDYLYGLSRMFSILGQQTRPNLHVVHTMKEAMSLLGVTSLQFSRVSVS